MTDRKHVSNVNMSSSTHLKSSTTSTSLSAKVSSASSQLFQPHPMMSTTMMPSIEAYLEAYQSLLGGGTFGRDHTSALSALASNYPVRPTGTGLPMSMPFIPPSYFTFPSYPMDMSPYGLMSPVLLPPFFASLYCDPSSSSGGVTAAATAAAAAAALGRGPLMTDYRDSQASMKINSALQWPGIGDKEDAKQRTVESKENTAARMSTTSHGSGSGPHIKKDASTSAVPHSNVRSTPTKETLSRSQPPQQHTHGSSISKSLHSSVTFPPTYTGGDLGPRTSKNTLPVNSSDKMKSRQSDVTSSHMSFPDQDGGPIDFSAATAANRSSSSAAVAAREATHTKESKSAAEASGSVPSRASVVVTPTSDKDKLAVRVTANTVVNYSSSDVKSSPMYRTSNMKDFKPLNDFPQPGIKNGSSSSSEIHKSTENGRLQKDVHQYGQPLDVSTKAMSLPPIPPTNQQPLRLDASTVSLLKNVKADAQPLIRQESSTSSTTGVMSLTTPLALLPSCPPSGGLQLQPSPIEADKAATSINGIVRRRLSKPDRKRQHESAPTSSSTSVTCATDLSVASTAAAVASSNNAGSTASSAAGVEEFRCSLCNYSGRSQHCLTKHMRAHDVAYKICQYCRRAFERPSDLLRHEERHRRRDVSGSSPLAGGALTPLPLQQQQQQPSQLAPAGTCSSVVSCLSVGRVDSYSGGTMDWTNLIAVGVGSGDNEVVLDFDNLSSASQANSRPPPEPSKLRDVYSIMAGIVVAQSLASMSPGKSQPAYPFIDVTPLQTSLASADKEGRVIPTTTPIVQSAGGVVIESTDKIEKSIGAVVVQTGDSTKVEFLRKLELEVADADQAGHRRSITGAQQQSTIIFAEEAGIRKHRRKGRPVRASVSRDKSEEITDQSKSVCDGANTSENYDTGKLVNTGDFNSKKRSGTSERDGDDGVEAKKQHIAVAAVVERSPPSMKTWSISDEVGGGKVRKVSTSGDKRQRSGRGVIGKLVLRSRLFQRRQVKRGTVQHRYGEKTDSNGNALPPKSFRGGRRFSASAEMPRHRVSKRPNGRTRRGAVDHGPVAKTRDKMATQSDALFPCPEGL